MGLSSAKETELAKALMKAEKIALWELYETDISAETLYNLEKGFSSFSEPEIRCEDPISNPKSAVYHIITSNKMKKTQRLRLMQILALKKALSLDPIGPENLSPPFLCQIRHSVFDPVLQKVTRVQGRQVQRDDIHFLIR